MNFFLAQFSNEKLIKSNTHAETTIFTVLEGLHKVVEVL